MKKHETTQTEEEKQRSHFQECVTILTDDPGNVEARRRALQILREMPPGEPVDDEEGIAELTRIWNGIPEVKRPLFMARMETITELFVAAYGKAA